MANGPLQWDGVNTVLRLLKDGPKAPGDLEKLSGGSPEQLEAALAQLSASRLIEPFTARLKHQQNQLRWRLTSKGKREAREYG